MLDPKKVKIGIAPIAWTEDDMPEMGAENASCRRSVKSL